MFFLQKKYNLKSPDKVLKWSLLGGAIYFLLVAIVHMTGIKVPGLYIYFNVPSYAYQDRIIALLSFGWCMFLYSGFKLTGAGLIRPVRYIILAGIAAIICLLLINNSEEIKELATNRSRWIYMIETMILFIYTIWLMILYIYCRRK
jgi:hypothetical protein